MINRAACEAALKSANVRAFLLVIRKGESSLTDDAYRMINGGGRIADLSRHPYDGIPTTRGARASGAYQFLGTTWAGVKVQLELYDFSPASQDLAAVGLIQGRGALDDVLAGNFDTAVAKLRREWTSLPGASENHSHWTMEKARALYVQQGGVIGNVSHETTPAPNDSHASQPEPRKPMAAPLLLALAPMLAELIPQIAKLFASGSEVSTRNVAAVEAVSKAVVAATNTPNVQAAIEAMQADPAVRQAAQEAVVTDPIIMGLLEIGGGVNRAREADLQAQQAGPVYKSPAFVVVCLLLPLIYMVVSAVVFNLGGSDWSDEMRSVVVTAIVTGLLGAITGYFLGSSYGSQRKSEVQTVARL